MRRWLIAAALALGLAGSASAKVGVTWDVNFGYSVGTDPLAHLNVQLQAVRAILGRWNADYIVVPPTNMLTWFLRTGNIYQRTAFGANYGYDSTKVVANVDAWINLNFNGSGPSTLQTQYRPDSLSLFVRNYSPLVPNLMVIDDERAASGGGVMANAASCSTGVAPLAGSEVMSDLAGFPTEGQTTCFSTEGPECWFETVKGVAYARDTADPFGGAPGGVHVLIARSMNSVGETIRMSGLMTQNPDSCGRAATDSMKVWEVLNSNKFFGANNTIPARPIVYCGFGNRDVQQDSTGAVSYSQGDLANLTLAIMHLDSLAGGKVLGNNKRPGVGFVITHVGDRSQSRMNPGGIFAADTALAWQSCDSMRVAGMNVLAAADPESLSVNAGDIAGIKRIGKVRFTPFTRAGIDTLALGANGNSTLTSPKDAFGRYRNRAFIGDSTFHAVNGADTSIAGNLSAGKKILTALGLPLSTTVVPPDFDWSPFQVRAGQNMARRDSFYAAIRYVGFDTVVGLTLGRDGDANYKVPPVGWQNQERMEDARIGFVPGERPRMLCATTFPVSGSSKFIVPIIFESGVATPDTVPPYLSSSTNGGFPRPNVVVGLEERFWGGYFLQRHREYEFDTQDRRSLASDIFYDSRDKIYGQQGQASILAIPAIWLGGGQLDVALANNGPVGTFANRPGWLAFKHVNNVISCGNRFAGRIVWAQQFPEEIQP